MPPGRFIISRKATQEQNEVILMSQLWGLPKCTLLRTERNKIAVNNNWIDGLNKKIDHAKYQHHWFVNDDDTCKDVPAYLKVSALI